MKCSIDQVPGRTEELFRKWKSVTKKKKAVDTKELVSDERFEGCAKDILEKTAGILSTQPEHVI
ncbi:MAG: hypothetical protein NT001_00845, partial [Candidatus Woesearchaeota archaeon]|nr:hypothetical protein [Candidatus Woesearchaeota archaeon]